MEESYDSIYEEDHLLVEWSEDYLEEYEEVDTVFWIQFEIILTQYDDVDELTEQDLIDIEAFLEEAQL